MDSNAIKFSLYGKVIDSYSGDSIDNSDNSDTENSIYKHDIANNSNDNIKIKKIKFSCKICNYKTIRESQYERHVKTKKHKNNVINNGEDINKTYKCNCGNEYKYASGLSKHKKKCNYQKEHKYEDEETDDDEEEEEYGKMNMVQLKKQITGLKKENKMLEEMALLKDQIIELTKKSVVNITNNNVKNMNNTFNLHVFLNETCKDAMNINEFVESIEISIEDLKYLGKKGYVEGMSKLITNNLTQLDVTKRPLHCSDAKRETIYIKQNNSWEKETTQRERLKKVLFDISRLNTIALTGLYKETYPKCMTDYDSKEHEEYGEIVYQALGGKTNDINFQNKKIVRRLVNHIEIQKKDYC